MDWKELRNSPEKLLELANEIGTRGVGEEYNVNKDTVNRWLKKHGFTYDIENSEWIDKYSENKNNNVNDVDDFEQYLKASSPQNVDIEKDGDRYIIEKDEETISINEDKLKDIYYDYCELELTIEETCLKNDIIPDDFKIIKQTFDIIHASLPLTDEEILENSVDENIQKILQNKKRRIKEKKPAEELRYLRNIADKYFKKHHEAQRILNALEDKIQPIEYIPRQKSEVVSDNDMLVTLSDIHYGKQVLSCQTMGIDKDFDKYELEARLNKYVDRVIDAVDKFNPETIYFAFLGDIGDNPLSNTYPNQREYQDVAGERQVLECADLLAKFILDIRNDHSGEEKVIVVPGNHTDDKINTDILIMGIVERMLGNYQIEFDVSEQKYKLKTIRDNHFVFFHGEHLSSSTNKRENNILNIIHSFNLQGKNTYLISAHKHHEDGEGVNYEHKQVPSIVGSDAYATEKINKKSRPSQMFFLVSEEGMINRHKVYFD